MPTPTAQIQPGDRWALPSGREVLVMPVLPSEDAIACRYVGHGGLSTRNAAVGVTLTRRFLHLHAVPVGLRRS